MSNYDGSGIVNRVKEITGSQVKAYFVIWKYAPELMPKKNLKTFQDLADSYASFKEGTTEDGCNAWLIVDEKVQRAVKWLLQRLHQRKIIELYDKFYKLALDGDVQAFNAFIKFSNSYFVDDNETELSKILRGVSFADENDENEGDRE